MAQGRHILIAGGGTAGWLTACYLARALGRSVRITLLESPDIGIIGVGEGSFPTIRDTLRFLGIDEASFVRETSATFKQGVRFTDWVDPPADGRSQSYFHPFEPPFYTEGASLVPYWLLEDEATRPPFAAAMTIQHRVAAAGRAPKQPGEGDFAGPLNYAYHLDAVSLSRILGERGRQLGVEHLSGRLDEAVLDPQLPAGSHASKRVSGRSRPICTSTARGFAPRSSATRSARRSTPSPASCSPTGR